MTILSLRGALIAGNPLERRLERLREFAIVLSDDWQGRGLGTRLLVSLLVAAKSQGVRRLVGTILSENKGMLALGRKLGFRLAKDPGSASVPEVGFSALRGPGDVEGFEHLVAAEDPVADLVVHENLLLVA